MNKSLRKTIIAGNWKMNNNQEKAKILINEIKPLVANANSEVVVCVPYTDLETVLNECKGTNIKVGAQNCHFEKSGAYTGEISAEWLKDMGVEYVIIGHSERRQYFAETDATVNKRTKSAIEAGLNVLLCVGEMLEDRESGITDELVTIQTKKALLGISKSDLSKITIAYEPVWAIGTGKTATSEQANEVCGLIRNVIEKLYDKQSAESMSILYGGSMNPSNADELLAKSDVDGGLIGGASLKAQDFASIVDASK